MKRLSDLGSAAPSGNLPYKVPVPVVLDTGLTSNATFLGPWFEVELAGGQTGGVGFNLEHTSS